MVKQKNPLNKKKSLIKTNFIRLNYNINFFHGMVGYVGHAFQQRLPRNLFDMSDDKHQLALLSVDMFQLSKATQKQEEK